MEFQALLTPLHKGTSATIGRMIPLPPRNPFGKFGDRSLCTHLTSEFDADGFEVDEPQREYCVNNRIRLAHGFLCESHSRKLYPQGRPIDPATGSVWNPVVANMLDARHIIAHEKEILRGARVRSVRLLTDDERVKLDRVGHMRWIERGQRS